MKLEEIGQLFLFTVFFIGMTPFVIICLLYLPFSCGWAKKIAGLVLGGNWNKKFI